jgi:hypothetical protein
MIFLSKLEEEVASWQTISVQPHRFGGRGVALGAPKSDTSTSVVFLISRSRLQFAMRSWPEAVGIY